MSLAYYMYLKAIIKLSLLSRRGLLLFTHQTESNQLWEGKLCIVREHDKSVLDTILSSSASYHQQLHGVLC